MKIFYAERDIVDMDRDGVKEIEVCDDIVLTDLAREKAASLGIRLKRVAQQDAPQEPALQAPAPQSVQEPSAPATAIPPCEELARRVKAALIAKLGPGVSEVVLDAVIQRVLHKSHQ